VHRRYLAGLPRSFPAAPSRYLGVVPWPYKSSPLTSKNIVRSGKNLDVRRVQICVRKLATNAGDSAFLECAGISLERVTKVG
jgi:hypothetical protein